MATKQATANKASKKKKLSISHVIINVKATFNNTKITITDAQGNALFWASAGQHFKGARKRTPFAAQVASEGLIDGLKAAGVRTMEAIIKGPGPGREAAVKPFGSVFQVLAVKDVTPVPHNGCRPKKQRRA